MANKQPEPAEMKHIIASQLHLYYERTDDGTCMLRRIRVNNHRLIVPDEGVVIDNLPPNIIGEPQMQTASVGSRAIENEAVNMEDLSPDVREAIAATEPVADESDVRDIVNNY